MLQVGGLQASDCKGPAYKDRVCWGVRMLGSKESEKYFEENFDTNECRPTLSELSIQASTYSRVSCTCGAAAAVTANKQIVKIPHHVLALDWEYSLSRVGEGEGALSLSMCAASHRVL